MNPISLESTAPTQSEILNFIDRAWDRFNDEPWLHALMLRGLAGKALRAIALEGLASGRSVTLDKLRAQGTTAAMTADERMSDLQRHAALWSRVPASASVGAARLAAISSRSER